MSLLPVVFYLVLQSVPAAKMKTQRPKATVIPHVQLVDNYIDFLFRPGALHPKLFRQRYT